MCQLERECECLLFCVGTPSDIQFYGLIAPGIEMADILAFNLVSEALYPLT